MQNAEVGDAEQRAAHEDQPLRERAVFLAHDHGARQGELPVKPCVPQAAAVCVEHAEHKREERQHGELRGGRGVLAGLAAFVCAYTSRR